MRQASKRIPESAEKTVRDIRRATRRHHSAEEKIRIVLEGLRGEDSIAELCRKEGINQNLYYRWSKEFLEAGKKRLAGDTALTMRSTGRAEVSGSVHLLTIFGLPLAVCCIAMITRFAPVTRSIAPPIPGTILPGIIQFASRPWASTCSAPSTVISTWPPRMSPNDMALSKMQAPGRAVTGWPPASVSSR